ncbi:MAG: DUF6428 family protein [Flavobacteriaceae bacterium]
MKTSEFLELLSSNQDKSLLFEYTPGKLVGANYHITEVKHIAIESVNCGAGTDAWNETIIQLWESPLEKEKTSYMSTYKALSILKKVGRAKPFDLDAEIKFEYGNSTFHTAQLFVSEIEISGNQLIVKLAVEKTDCKAKEACGIPETIVAEEEACCAPESGCC